MIAVDLACPECGAAMVLKPSRFGKFYACVEFPKCRGSHGAHPDGSPLGTPANRATKDARIAAHAAFDTLWMLGGMKRKEAYRWMPDAMGMSKDDAHIGRFTIAQCDALIALINAPKRRSPALTETEKTHD